MRKMLRLLMVLGGGLLACPSWAQNQDGGASQTPDSLQAGAWHAAIGLSQLRLKLQDGGIHAALPSLPADASLQGDSFNLALQSGYQMDEYLGLQGEMIFGGTARATAGGSKKSLFDAVLLSAHLVAGRDLTQTVRAYLLAGGTFWDFSQWLSNDVSLKVNSGFGLSYGAGLDINVYGPGDRRLRLQWTRHQFDGVIANQADNLSASLVFYFR